MTTYSTDTDMTGTLLTTEWGNPPQSQPAGVPNYQGYGAPGQGIEAVYPYLYNPTVDVPPLDESEGGLALQEQKWVGEVEYIQENDPDFLAGADITGDVVFENPLDTLSAADTSLAARSAGQNVVDYDAVKDPGSDGPLAFGVSEAPAGVVPDEPLPLVGIAPEDAPEAEVVEEPEDDALAHAGAESSEDEVVTPPTVPQGENETTEADEPVVAPVDESKASEAPVALPDQPFRPNAGV